MQPIVNIGFVGHVDHGKTSLTKALTGKWTDTYSEELKRGITIKIGFADASFYFCKKCQRYGTAPKCTKCKGDAEFTRKVSFLDAPGHETLMTTTIAAASVLDGALLVIGANEGIQPQTEEHLMMLDILGIKKVVIALNKIDLVNKEQALKVYQKVRELIKGTAAEGAPIIPVSANANANIDVLVEAIEKTIETPKRDESVDPLMYVVRSFDINRPGSEIEELNGGVIGGTLVKGVIKKGDNIAILPGTERKKEKGSEMIVLTVKVSSLHSESERLDVAAPGGLIAIGTQLDPALTKRDSLIGSIVGKPGKMPPVTDTLTIKYSKIRRIGFEHESPKDNDVLVVCCGTMTAIGIVLKAKKQKLQIKLKRPVCLASTKMAILKKVGHRWRLTGMGELAA